MKAFIPSIILLSEICNALASTDSWPSGSYSLPKPLSGCPRFWKEGWLKQDLEDDAIKNSKFISKFSPNFHMSASIIDQEFVKQAFCTKSTHTFKTKRWTPWPKGYYCIYRKFICPHDMTEGSILWDDEDSNNGNDKRGYLPDLNQGYSAQDTILHYCCQNQGKWYEAIELPTEKPFYLLPYGSQNCQRVKWAVSSLEYIIYDTEDTQPNWDQFNGHHVFTDEVKSLPKIYYCYYEGCQYNLQGHIGSFTSSKFSNLSNSDFGICSWSITVNVSQRIILQIQTVNIFNCEENHLDVYDNNRSALLARFCGENGTSRKKLTSTRNTLYVVFTCGSKFAFWNKDDSSALGFYAEYQAVEIATTTVFSPTLPFIKLTNNTFHGERKNLQKSSSNNVPILVLAIVPVLAILLLVGVVFAILYWRRYGNHKPLKISRNPIYESGENKTYEDADGAKTRDEADNVLYESATEIWEPNPIYEAVE